MTPNKFCFIMRALPGAGKDIIASLMTGPDVSIISTDDYFMKDGKFNFDKTLLKEAHKASFQAFKEAIEREIKVIIINNTNIKKYHYSHYLDYAQRHNYLTSIIIIPHNNVSNRELADRNVHGVDQNTIRKMRYAFEWEV